MLLSTQTENLAGRFGIVKAVEMLASAGFDAVDLSLFDNSENEFWFTGDWEPVLKQALKTARENGVSFNQSHAPFATMRDGDDEYNAYMMPRVKRAVEIAGTAGVKNIVVHPVCFKENQTEKNLAMYDELLPYAKNAGVKIAVENMWGRDDRRGVIRPNVCSTGETLGAFYDLLDKKYFSVCLDIGHIGLVGEYEYETIKTLGHDRLHALHVHDNDYIHDSHTLPFTMKLPWADICRGLKEIDYSGDFTYEADNFISRVPDELIPAALKYMVSVGRYLMSQC